MNKEKKITFMQRQFEYLKTQLDELKKENEVLEKINSSLKSVCESQKEELMAMQKIISDTNERQNESIREAVEAKDKYENAYRLVIELRDSYDKEIKSHLNRLRKQI